MRKEYLKKFYFKMNLSLCLITYVLLFLIIFLILLKIGKDTFSSFILSLCIGFIYLLIIFPPHHLKIEVEDYSYSALYTFIITGSMVVFLTITICIVTMYGNDKIFYDITS